MKIRNRKDIFTILFICLAAMFLMTACMNSAGNDTNAPSASPSAQATVQPTVQPAQSSQPGFDWANSAGEIETRIAQFSEISEARVIVNGDTALVAVKFAPAYQGDMTSRIRDMISGEVMSADPSIKTVAVTAEEEDVTRVYDLTDRTRAGETIDSIANDIDEIIRNATTLT